MALIDQERVKQLLIESYDCTETKAEELIGKYLEEYQHLSNSSFLFADFIYRRARENGDFEDWDKVMGEKDFAP